MRSIAYAIFVAYLAACSSESAAPASSQCHDDTDCKGDLVCSHGKCVEGVWSGPTSSSGVTGGGAPTGGASSGGSGGAGGVPASECLQPINCVGSLDCPNGYH